MNATIDAAGSGEYAELDDLGRYKVKLPFDQSDMEGGKASRWVRMSQPYAGVERGIHFPLPKGTEVLLTFVDGDPDRPVIAGAVPNPETASPVTAVNQSESVIKTGGNNKIRIQDLVGSERIIMETPAANSWIRVGTPNDPPAKLSKKLEKLIETHNFIKDRDPSKGIKIFTKGNYIAESQGHQKVILDDVRKGEEVPQFQLSNDTIIEIYDALVDLKTRRDNDYNGIQEPAGKSKFAPKKISDDDIKKIINYLDPNNPYPPTTSNTGQPKAYTDKADFITKTKGTDANYSGSELNDLGISDWGEKQEAIIRIILQYAENKNAWKRTVDIEGEQFYMTDGCHKIEAINGDLKFEMTDGGIVIDSGDKDVTIKCRKFNVVNELEDNTTFSDDLLYHYGNTEEYTYGKSYSEFRGTAEEHFYGFKDEHFYGNKSEIHGGAVEELFIGGKTSTCVGGSTDTYVGGKIDSFAGVKMETFLSAALSIGLGVSLDIKKVLELEMKGIHIQKNDVEMENRLTKIESGQAEIANKLMVVHSGMKIHA